VQVDAIKPSVKPPGTKRFKLEYGKLLSNFAFKFNLRRYNMVRVVLNVRGVPRGTHNLDYDVATRGRAYQYRASDSALTVTSWVGGWALHSSNLRLNVSLFCGIPRIPLQYPSRIQRLRRPRLRWTGRSVLDP